MAFSAADTTEKPPEQSLGAIPAVVRSARERAWHHSIAGKLLIAFGLIAGLTVAAAFLSLIRFQQIEGVLHGLTEVSMPALKLAMDVQIRASDVIDTAGAVGAATDDVERFTAMAGATERIGLLWQSVGQVGAVIAEDKMVSIREGTAQIDAQVGNLNRAVGESISTNQSLAKLALQIEQAITAANGAITSILDRIARDRTPSPGDAPVAAAPQTATQLLNLRADLLAAGSILNSIRYSNNADTFVARREQFGTILHRMESAVAGISAGLGHYPEVQALAASLQNVADRSGGDTGVFALWDASLRERASLASINAALNESGRQLREKVAAVVADAESQAAGIQQRAVSAIWTSRIWLVLIAVTTLILASLIVWLFVYRYVVSRLEALVRSMFEIARGNLAMPVPAAGADELGEMSRALLVFRDNARDIQIAKDQAVKARAEAEAASRAKSTFLANMSHELRTPLNAIIGYSEMLSEDAADRGDDASVQDLQKIQASGRHLLGLINSILDLSKIEAGRMDIYLEQVNLRQLIEEVRVIVQPLVDKNRNRLTIECAPDIGSMRTDVTKLKQSLINLLSNAAKFTENGEVRLGVERREESAGSQRVVFTVADNGIGMTEEQMSRLFEAFSQADSSTTRNFGGTGLGLAITKRFAALLGGSINVTSKQGGGSVFTFDLLDHSLGAVPLGPRTETDSELDGRALTVLIVDDDAAVHELVTPFLTKRGYRVLHARDGAEALDLMRKIQPDIVTLDVMMPKVDGWSVLGAMKSDEALEHIPVIMLTIVDDRNLGYSLGAAEYMTKPVDRERLLMLVRRFTSRKQDAVVLIVDDDPEVRNVAVSTLRRAGLQTAEAEHGRAALEWLEENSQPDLVLLDLMMPEMDGFQFLDRIRDKPEWLDIPIVVLTAKDMTAEEKAFLAERTILVLGKSAQPINSLGAALAAIATTQHSGRPDAKAKAASS